MEQFSLSSSRKTVLNKSEVTASRDHKSQKYTQEDRQCLLIVGDDFETAGMLNEALQEWGYDVIVARNGWEALIVTGRRSVDGMLVDMDMPIMDGRTMLKELRWLGYEIPVLMIVGVSEERIQRQLLMEGAQGCCMKPFHLSALQQVCSQVFAKGEFGEQPLSQFHIA